jgi:uncharacterized repeat protein (TIGR01451 family)
VTCSIGSLNPGAGADIKIKVTAISAGTVTDTASVQSDQLDVTPANNSATTTTTVRPLADLAVTMTESPSPAFVGNRMTYAITVTNNGPSTATGVTGVDTLPDPKLVTYESAVASQGSCSVSGKNVTCSLGTLASGASATITVKVTAIKDGKASNKVIVTANESDPTGRNNSATANTDIKK